MSVPTSKAISPDSGEHWTAPGAWQVADGVHRIPLPLPMDGLKAINVYVLEGTEDDAGLTLVDGGWGITEGREALEAGLKTLGAGFGDISRILVTHIHRDHYTLASALGEEYGAKVALGAGERRNMERIWQRMEHQESPADSTGSMLYATGAAELAEAWANATMPTPGPNEWRAPDTWIAGDVRLEVAGRTLDAVHTPGHTQGHYVYADDPAGLLFAGDHVLPTITPSIGFEPVPVVSPLGDFMASLTKVRGLPDLRLLPAHGPVAPSSHARIDELLAHHEHRLAQCLAAVRAGRVTAVEVARDLGWTRHERSYDSLDTFNSALAALETKAHLELLAARGEVTRAEVDGIVRFAPVTAS